MSLSSLLGRGLLAYNASLIISHFSSSFTLSAKKRKIRYRFNGAWPAAYLGVFVIMRRSPVTSYLSDSLCSKFSAAATLILKVKETVSLPIIEVTVPLGEELLFSRPPLNL
jgi:hypothetical protein